MRSSEAAMDGVARSAPYGVLMSPKRRVRAAHGAHARPKHTSILYFVTASSLELQCHTEDLSHRFCSAKIPSQEDLTVPLAADSSTDGHHLATLHPDLSTLHPDLSTPHPNLATTHPILATPLLNLSTPHPQHSHPFTST